MTRRDLHRIHAHPTRASMAFGGLRMRALCHDLGTGGPVDAPEIPGACDTVFARPDAAVLQADPDARHVTVRAATEKDKRRRASNG